MVKLSTAVQCGALPELTYSDPLVVIGSCFSLAMGQRLAAAKFNALVNPHGTLFNPSSIALTVRAALTGDIPPVASFVASHGAYVHTSYHSQLARATAEESQTAIAEAHAQLASQIRRARWLVVTFGSAWVYRMESGDVATNCHRMPAQLFQRSLLEVSDIVADWTHLMGELRLVNPELQLLLTVSPVRHLKDGLRENAISKATLLLAAHQLVQSLPGAYYFPAYEIFVDELRDYRYYADDLVHPSHMGEELVWERLQDAWLSPSTKALVARHAKVAKALSHRPSNPGEPAYQHLLRELLAEIEALESLEPTFDYAEERANIHALLRS